MNNPVKARPAGRRTPSKNGQLQSFAFLEASMASVQTNIFIADTQFNIIFANPRALETLHNIEHEIRKAFGVGADEIVGGSIHRFHKSKENVERILRNPAALPHRVDFTFGAVTLQTRVNAILSSGREVLGYIVNWEDISEKLKVERQVQEASDRERRHAEDLRSKVEHILQVVEAAGRGDLTKTLNIKGSDSVGQMAEGLTKFFTNLRGNVSNIAQTAQVLASSSHELTSVSQQMAATAEETATQAGVASAAAEQVSRNVTTVSTGTEEMGASIKEIAKSANEAAKVATSAVRVAEKTNAIVAKLGESSAE